MCGISGYIGKHKIDRGSIDRTLNLMKNRGPDHQAYVDFSSSNIYVCLMHSRLKIIDLDARANQPFSIDHYTIIFNGEIYNYKELRQELEVQGVSLKTYSDTEVLLASYIKYGERCVEKFEGMWSFAIFDARESKMFLSRDRFAEKPLYYLETPDGFFFASEIKFLKSLSDRSLTVNYQQLLRYFVNGYKSLYKHKETFFKNIHEVDFATNITIDQEQNIKFYKYWIPAVNSREMTLEDAIEGVRERLINSLNLRLRADVPLAFCLSGGVDSAGLVSLAGKVLNREVATYSIIDSDERYNEMDNIKATVNDVGCKATYIELNEKDNLKRLKKLIEYHDAPIATISYLVHSQISEAIAKDGYKIAISGTAADEILTGYYDHFNLHLYEMKGDPAHKTCLKDWQEHTGKFVRNPYLKNPELYTNNVNFRGHIYLNNEEFASYLKDGFQEDFIEEKYCKSLLRNRMMNEMFHEGTRVILHEDDLNSMFYSIENRSPYLDTKLFDFAYSIPTEYLIKEGYGKYVLREALKGILNDQVRLDRKKKGFNASISSVVDFSRKEDRAYLLEDSPIYNLFEREKIEALLDQESYPNSFSKFLFNFINGKIFLEQKS